VVTDPIWAAVTSPNGVAVTDPIGATDVAAP
jgi:hypothetical protein